MLKFKLGLALSALAISIASPTFAACVDHLDDMVSNEGTYLDLYNCSVHDKDMDKVVSFIKQHNEINYIDLTYNPITDTGLEKLNTIGERIEGLSLAATHISATGLLALNRMTGLRSIDVSDDHLTDDGAYALSRFNSVEYLIADGNAFTDTAAEYFKSLKKLHSLYLYGSKLTDTGVIALANAHPDMGQLVLDGSQVTETGAKAISRLKQLYLLSLTSDIGDRGVYWISRMPHLSTLFLKNVNIKDKKSFDRIASISGLMDLYLYNCNVDDEAVTTLLEKTNLSTFGFNHNRITDKGVEAIIKHGKAQFMNLGYNPIGEKGVIALSKYQPAGGAQYALNLDGIPLGKKEFKALAESDTIHFLSLNNTRMDDRSVAFFANNKKMTNLYIRNNELTDAGALALAKTTTLQVVDVSYNHISKIGLNALRSSIYMVMANGNDGFQAGMKKQCQMNAFSTARMPMACKHLR